MEDTVFAKIIRREIPAEIVYEDEETLAFLDIAPTNPGHTLVVPKKPFRNLLDDVDDATLLSLMKTVKKVASAVQKATGATGVNVVVNNEAAAGQIVFHLHFHVIPRFADDRVARWTKKKYAEGEAAKTAEGIRQAIAC
jgi:histidine triad (HIT) family protein